MEYSLLGDEQLSAEALRVLASAPSKAMAARGMAPLANPIDLTSVLYQICCDSDVKLASAAKASAQGLPKALLLGALAEPKLDPRVLDYFIHHAACKSELVETVILNQGASDETIAKLATRANPAQVDLIAQNEERILRSPAIIAALYKNTRARMSTVDRVVELAVRHEIKVSAIAAWDEVTRAVLQELKSDEPALTDEAKDNLFETTAKEAIESDDDARPSNPEEQEIAMRDLTIPMKIRLAMLGTRFQRAQLIRDSKKMVAMAVIKSPGVKENEAAQYAGNNALCDEVIGYISNRKEWTKLYHVKLSLVTNPKCPLPSAMRLLPHLRRKDITNLSRSRSVPSALSSQAKKLVAARQSRK